MKKISLITLLTFFSFTSGIAQIPVGYYYDINGDLIEGYLDQLEYNPTKRLQVTYNAYSFEPGYYYDLNGKKTEGFVNFKNKKPEFKKTKSDEAVKLDPTSIKGIVIGKDSFFVTQNFQVEESETSSWLRKKPELMQFLAGFGGYTFARHFDFLSKGDMFATALLGGSDASATHHSYDALRTHYSETFHVKKNTSDVWTLFPEESEGFKKVALKCFGHIPHLRNKIEDYSLGLTDMMALIKTAEYHHKFEKKEKVYFDEYWQETRDKESSTFQANIVNKEDSIWSLEYYRNDKKLYFAQYSLFYPFLKNGDFISFFDSGRIRKASRYKNNNLIRVETSYEDGARHHTTVIKMKTQNETGKPEIVRYMTDSSASVHMDHKGNYKEIYKDPISSRTIINVFQHAKLIESYRLIGQEKVFQVSDPNYNLQTQRLQKKLDSFFKGEYFTNLTRESVEGIVLISVTIDENGYPEDYKVLNKLHPDIDSLIADFLSQNLHSNLPDQYRFKPYRNGKRKVACEVLIPISFDINRFYKKPISYYRTHHHPVHHPVTPTIVIPAGAGF